MSFTGMFPSTISSVTIIVDKRKDRIEDKLFFIKNLIKKRNKNVASGKTLSRFEDLVKKPEFKLKDYAYIPKIKPIIKRQG